MPFIRSSSPKRSGPYDIGIGAINQVHDLWRIDDRWSVRDRRGFTWWAGHHRQHVYVDEGREDYGMVVYRLSAVTELLSGIDPDRPSTRHWIASMNAGSASHALVLEDHTRSVSLFSSVLLHAQSADWLVPHFAALAITQLAFAEHNADLYAQLLGGVPNRSHHPRSGIRRHHDEMLGVVEDIYKPLGLEQSKWIASGEFEELPSELRRAGFFFSAGGRYGLITQTEFGTESATIRATGSEPHHRLGSGLRLSLALPVVLDEQAATALSVELNTAEAEGFTRSHCLGAWTIREEQGGHVPEFVSFVPNAIYQSGLSFNLILSLGLKARWARREIAPYIDEGSEHQTVKRDRRVTNGIRMLPPDDPIFKEGYRVSSVKRPIQMRRPYNEPRGADEGGE